METMMLIRCGSCNEGVDYHEEEDGTLTFSHVSDGTFICKEAP